jgi:hypothetical protein
VPPRKLLGHLRKWPDQLVDRAVAKDPKPTSGTTKNRLGWHGHHALG